MYSLVGLSIQMWRIILYFGWRSDEASCTLLRITDAMIFGDVPWRRNQLLACTPPSKKMWLYCLSKNDTHLSASNPSFHLLYSKSNFTSILTYLQEVLRSNRSVWFHLIPVSKIYLHWWQDLSIRIRCTRTTVWDSMCTKMTNLCLNTICTCMHAVLEGGLVPPGSVDEIGNSINFEFNLCPGVEEEISLCKVYKAHYCQYWEGEESYAVESGWSRMHLNYQLCGFIISKHIFTFYHKTHVIGFIYWK